MQAQHPEICDQVQQKICRYCPECRIFVLAAMVSCVTDREEDDLFIGRTGSQSRLEHTRVLDVAAFERQGSKIARSKWPHLVSACWERHTQGISMCAASFESIRICYFIPVLTPALSVQVLASLRLLLTLSIAWSIVRLSGNLLIEALCSLLGGAPSGNQCAGKIAAPWRSAWHRGCEHMFEQ